MFSEVGELDFPELERQVLAFWEREGVFDKLREKNRGGKRYSFMDGPITANNPRGIGVHHAWGRTYKDIFQRHRAMQGCELRYQNGFDGQGLWVEVEVEKELGLDTKREILAYGLERFARQCRQRVERSAVAIVATSKRLGQWMDWGNSYFTYADRNIEHIWHFLKECHARGWLYKGERVMPWCVRCGTSLSQHELADAHGEVVHRAVYLALPRRERPGERVLVWTTTPWTLTANAALAVHPGLEYARVRQGNEVLYVARDAVARLVPGGELLGVVRGEELVGSTYGGPFDELPAQEGVVRRVVAWDQVEAGEGSGVVHVAPGCGPEDFALGQELGLAVLAPLDEEGRYGEGYGRFAGRRYSEVTELVCAALREKGLLYRVEECAHRYPHCWRCGTELVFRPVGEWFIACDAVRPRMIEAARGVRWIPEQAGKRMEDWLRNMGDWCISRKRYWGLPLPFYESADNELVVVGSKTELRALAVEPEAVDALPELHRPWIDAVEVRTPGGERARRVAEVGDCWLDAGIAPFSTLGYLDRARGEWERWFPADFAVEMREQVRLWFYSMLFMGVVLEGRAPYRTVMTYEKMHDEEGKPMHKSAGNAIWFDEAVERTGAEPMRWLAAGQNPGLSVPFGYGPLDEVKRRFLTLWNTYRFYVQYANLDGVNPVGLDGEMEYAPLDRWLHSRLQVLVGAVGASLEGYDLPPAVRAFEEFFDELSNWYVRLSRRRFWKSRDDQDKVAAHATLYETLVALCRLLAPLLPFLSEAIYQNLVRAVAPDAPESVHLGGYPIVQEDWIDAALMADMAQVRRVVGLGRAARTARGLKVRQPLRRVLVAGEADTGQALERLGDLVRQELNVKTLEWVAGREALVERVVRPDFGLLGRRYGRLLPGIRRALAAADGAAAARLTRGESLVLEVNGERVVLDQEEVAVVEVPRVGLTVESEGGLTVALDVVLDPALREEGCAREFVHQVQGLRKRRGLAVADRIAVTYRASESIGQALERHVEYIRQETLCVEMERTAAELEGERFRIDGEEVIVSLQRV